MRILLLNQYFVPDVAASAQRVSELAEDLAAAHDVVVVAGRPSYDADAGRSAVRPAPARLRVRRVPSTTFRRSRAWQRVLNYVSYLAGALMAGLGGARPDLIIAATDPPLAALAGLILGRLRRAPVACLLWDIQPQVALEAGLMRPGLVSRCLSRLSRFALVRAAAVVAPTGDMARTAIDVGVNPGRVVVHSHWEDLAVVPVGQRDNAFSRRHGLLDRFVVMYSGNLGLTQELEQYVELARRLSDIRMTLVFIGDGAGRERLASAAAGVQGDVRLLPYQPRDAMGESLSAADVFLVPLRAGLTRFMLPSKVYTFMAAGRPIVAAIDPESDVAQSIREIGCGLVTAPADLDAIEARLRELHGQRDVREAMGRAGRAAAESRFSRPIVTAQYLAWIRQFEPPALLP